MKPRFEDPIGRVLTMTDLSGDCWLWSGCLRAGYGLFKLGGRAGRAVLVHRFMFEYMNGPIPAGMVVCHSCDTPACLNPAHLWLGTQADNMRDRDRKGRRARHRGGNGRRKLSRADVADIQRLAADPDITRAALARHYGVARSTISYAIERRSAA